MYVYICTQDEEILLVRDVNEEVLQSVVGKFPATIFFVPREDSELW